MSEHTCHRKLLRLGWGSNVLCFPPMPWSHRQNAMQAVEVVHVCCWIQTVQTMGFDSPSEVFTRRCIRVQEDLKPICIAYLCGGFVFACSLHCRPNFQSMPTGDYLLVVLHATQETVRFCFLTCLSSVDLKSVLRFQVLRPFPGTCE